MGNRHLIATLALAAGLGACHKNYDTDNPAPAYKASASDSASRAMTHTVQLQSENNSGITGSAVLTPSGTDTKVMLTLVPPAARRTWPTSTRAPARLRARSWPRWAPSRPPARRSRR